MTNHPEAALMALVPKLRKFADGLLKSKPAIRIVTDVAAALEDEANYAEDTLRQIEAAPSPPEQSGFCKLAGCVHQKWGCPAWKEGESPFKTSPPDSSQGETPPSSLLAAWNGSSCQAAVGDLLAVINGDGGHYAHEHGTEKAARDAIAVYYAKIGQQSAPKAAEPQWQPMETAPKDGTLVLLLVKDDGSDEVNPLEDELESRTIGSYGVHGGPEADPEWSFAGWCWDFDMFEDGRGMPVAWAPLLPTHEQRARELVKQEQKND